jgi:ribose transport system permease protein
VAKKKIYNHKGNYTAKMRVFPMDFLPQRDKYTIVRMLEKAISHVGLLPIAIILLCLLFVSIESRFAGLSNIQNVIFQAGVLALISLGQFFPILSGGIDFSVGAQIGLASIVSSMLIVKYGIVPGILGGLLATALVGFVIGFVVVKFRANALIVSLGMYWLVSGVTLMICNGQNIYELPKTFSAFGVSRIAGIPISTIWATLAFLFCYFLLHKTRYGYQLYAVGANERTAKLSGISVDFTRIMSYVTCSTLTGFTGIVLTAALGSGQPSLGIELGMQNFIVVFIAGTRWGGGVGSIIKVAFGVIFVAVLNNGLNVLNVSSYAQMAVTGTILVAALCFDLMRHQDVMVKMKFLHRTRTL